jgi:outer membrane protein assembly factor BamB
MKFVNAFVILILLFIQNLNAQNSSQWRGPDRNGIYPETNLLEKWPENGPKLVWEIEGIGDGYSSASIYNNIVYITGKKEKLEYLSAINSNGKMLWQIPFGNAARQSYPESRTTPTIQENRIYVISGKGEVVCINANNSKKLWSVDAFDKFKGEFGSWEIAESPLLVNDKVIYTPGGHQTTLVALDKYTGETIWTTESLHDTTAYVSPLLVNWGNKKIIVNVTAKNIFGVNADDGKFLWTYNYYDLETPTWHPRAPVINANTPVFHDGFLYVTSGYNHVGAKFKLSDDATKLNLVWSDSTLDTHHGGVVLVDDYIYGSNWLNNSQGNWVCLDWKTGKVMYEKEWFNKGSIISANGMLYCYEEKRGNLALVKSTPKDFEVISSFRIRKGRGPHWAHPVISNKILYVRHGDVLMAYDIKKNE